MSEGGRSHRDR